MNETDKQKKKKTEAVWVWVCAMKGDVRSSPGMPALIFAWHFHA